MRLFSLKITIPRIDNINIKIIAVNEAVEIIAIISTFNTDDFWLPACKMYTIYYIGCSPLSACMHG